MGTNYIKKYSAKSRPDRINADSYLDQTKLVNERKRFTLKSYCFDNQTVQIVDKSSPHTLFDLMITVTSNNKSPLSFNELNDGTCSHVLKLCNEFVNYISKKEVKEKFNLDDSIVRISANVAKVTEDRFSIQGERTFHIHIICYPQEYSQGQTIDLNGEENKLDRLCVLDSLAFPGSVLLKKYLEKSGLDNPEIISKSNSLDLGKNTLCDSLFLEFKSWNSLISKNISKYFISLENIINEMFVDINNLFYEEEIPQNLGYWKRRKLLSKEQREKNIKSTKLIPEELTNYFLEISKNLVEINDMKMEEMRVFRLDNRSVGEPEFCLPYAGPTYTYTFFSKGTLGEYSNSISNTKMYLAITPLFTRTAGAGGLFFNHNGEIIKVSKNGKEFYSKEDMDLRKEFQLGFINSLL